MNPLPLVSVIIPNYNYGKYLKQCLQSVLNQTYPNIEIIVVDDASTDGSAAIYAAFQSLDKITILANARNSGVVYSRNRGIDAAKGELIALVDPDDYWLPQKLMQQVEAFKKESSDIVCTSLKIINDKEVIVGVRQSLFKDISYDTMLRSNSIAHSTVLLKKELFEREEYREVENPFFKTGLPIISKFNYLIHEDFALLLRLLKGNKLKVCYLSEPLVVYRRHKKNYSAGLIRKVLSIYVIFSQQEGFSVYRSILYTTRLMILATIKNKVRRFI